MTQQQSRTVTSTQNALSRWELSAIIVAVVAQTVLSAYAGRFIVAMVMNFVQCSF